jgi:hypothetical protein
MWFVEHHLVLEDRPTKLGLETFGKVSAYGGAINQSHLLESYNVCTEYGVTTPVDFGGEGVFDACEYLDHARL